MPLKEIDIKKYKIQIAEKDEVFVWIGPCSVKKVDLEKISLDGRKYECGGKVLLANGLVLQASFRIKKSDEPLLIEDSIYTKIDDTWYKLKEPEFYKKTARVVFVPPISPARKTSESISKSSIADKLIQARHIFCECNFVTVSVNCPSHPAVQSSSFS